MGHKKINIDQLKKCFRIKEGKLERLNLSYKTDTWTVVESKKNDKSGYCRIWFNGKNFRYHHILWVLLTGEIIPDGSEIDHINGNRIDNRIENLRLVTRRQNAQNTKTHRDGNLCGCYFHKIHKKYHSSIRIGGSRIFLGVFKKEDDAHEAYKIACKHITDYVDNCSFRELVKKELGESINYKEAL